MCDREKLKEKNLLSISVIEIINSTQINIVFEMKIIQVDECNGHSNK